MVEFVFLIPFDILGLGSVHLLDHMAAVYFWLTHMTFVMSNTCFHFVLLFTLTGLLINAGNEVVAYWEKECSLSYFVWIYGMFFGTIPFFFLKLCTIIRLLLVFSEITSFFTLSLELDRSCSINFR